MTIPDVNLLLYAHDAGSPQHAVIKVWLEKLFLGTEQIGFPWVVIWGFVRISTNRHIQGRPRTPEEAFLLVRGWLEEPRVEVVEPGSRHRQILENLVVKHQVSGSSVSDAVLAAVAIEHGATLASTDRGFRRFADLKWVNPLDQL